MALYFDCFVCGAEIMSKLSVGKEIACPSCKETVIVPASAKNESQKKDQGASTSDSAPDGWIDVVKGDF